MSTYVNFHAAGNEFLSAHSTSNLYFLLDNSGLPGMLSQLSKSSLEWGSLFDCTREANAIVAAPVVVLAGSNGRLQMSRLLCDWISKNGTYTSTVLMLCSPLELAPLMERLIARLDVTLSEDMAAMLRFFDPRVFESLTSILSAEQSIKFFSPAEAWQYLDRTGKLVLITSDFSSHDDFSAPLILSKNQESELLDASEADQVLDLLRSNLAAVWAKVPPEIQYKTVVQNIKLAKEAGLNSILNFAIYIAVRLMKGEEFIESPLWQRLLTKLKHDDLDLSKFFFSED